MLDVKKRIQLNTSEGTKGKFDTSVNTDKAQRIWKSNTKGFDILHRHYRIEGNRVLDAGCRVGVLSTFLMEMGYDVLGVDIVPRSVKDAVKHGVDAVQGDLMDMPFLPNESFDSVFCRDVIEHIPDPRKAFEEFVRITKPGGSIFIVGPFEEEPTCSAHLFAFPTLDFVEDYFQHECGEIKYCGLIEDEPITCEANIKMYNQSLKRDTWLLYMIKEKV